MMVACAAFAMASAASSPRMPRTAADLFSQRGRLHAPAQPDRPAAARTCRLQWDSRTGRWGFNLDMAQPGDRDMQWRDARVGLNYGVAPGVRTGVGVSLGDEQTPDGRKHRPPSVAQRRARAAGHHLQSSSLPQALRPRRRRRLSARVAAPSLALPPPSANIGSGARAISAANRSGPIGRPADGLALSNTGETNTASAPAAPGADDRHAGEWAAAVTIQRQAR